VTAFALFTVAIVLPFIDAKLNRIARALEDRK